jgi:CheY-like chemotaxis protein
VTAPARATTKDNYCGGDLDDRGIPYIFLTSYSAAAIPVEHRHQPLVTKPYSPERLLAQMQQFLG